MNIKPSNYKNRSRRLQYVIAILLLTLIVALVCLLDAHVLKTFILIAVFLLILCLIWYAFGNRRSFFEIYNTINIMQPLFDTYFNNKVINDALREVGYVIKPEFLYFIVKKNDGSCKSYRFKDKKNSKPHISTEEQIRLFHTISPNGHYHRVSLPKRGQPALDKEEIMKKYGIHTAECIEVQDKAHNMSGILLSVNAQKQIRRHSFEQAAKLLLTSVMHSIYIEKLENMGKFDSLTGLLNRNSYQKAISGYKNSPIQQLACIYIDLNDLHNINNTFGHDKGDRTLRFIADTLVNNFSPDDIFRIGGDEFIILCKYSRKADIENQISNMRREFTDKDCAVAIGVDWCENSDNIDNAIKNAEEKMFEEKNIYYNFRRDIPRRYLGGGGRCLRSATAQSTHPCQTEGQTKYYI